MGKQKGAYEDVPNYGYKISKIRTYIRQKEEEQRKGKLINGAILDARREEFYLEKRHVLAQAHFLAKKQNKETVVSRLLKSAEKADFLCQLGGGPLDKIGFHKLLKMKKNSLALGTVFLATGVLTSSLAPASIGAIALISSQVIRNKLKQKSSHYDLKRLKSYVKNGRIS